MKRLALALALSTALTNPALAGIAIINGGGTGGLIAQGSNNGGGTTVTTAASTVDVPSGSFVFMDTTVRSTNAGITGCVDSNGNSINGGGSNKTNPPTNQTLNWNWVVTSWDSPIGTTWTCTSITTTSKGIMVGAWTGAAASPHDASGSATPTAGTGTAMAITGNTLACPGGGANCELVIAAWTNHTLGAQSGQTAGFTQFGCIPSTTNSANICLAYELVSATTAQSYASTNATSDVWAMALEGFVAAVASTGHSLGALGAGN